MMCEIPRGHANVNVKLILACPRVDGETYDPRMSGSRRQMICVQASSFKSTVHPAPKSRILLWDGTGEE